MTLTLNERSYLMDVLSKYAPTEELWDLTEVITYPQRGRILALDRQEKSEEIKDMVENIKCFQLKKGIYDKAN